MEKERRASRRIDVELPFEWCVVEHEPNVATLLRDWGLGTSCVDATALAELDVDLEHHLRSVRDPAVGGALRALAGKVEVLAQRSDSGRFPPLVSVDLGADGIGFSTDREIAEGALLGIHLVLPAGHRIVCHARVSRCAERHDQPWVGAAFIDLNTASSRLLTQFVIR